MNLCKLTPGNFVALILILCAPVAVGFLVRDGLRDFNGKDRSVFVRGLAEREGVALGGGSQPSYIFTGLNTVKPEMIKEATANAFEAAEQFAADSGAEVGDIVTASQGVFSIDGRDDIQALGADAQLNKKVRVVTSVTYRLD